MVHPRFSSDISIAFVQYYLPHFVHWQTGSTIWIQNMEMFEACMWLLFIWVLILGFSYQTTSFFMNRSQIQLAINLLTVLITSKIIIFNLFIPTATKLGGVYWIHPVCLSVCPSVCLSVNLSCPPCSIYSSGWILSIFGTNDH